MYLPPNFEFKRLMFSFCELFRFWRIGVSDSEDVAAAAWTWLRVTRLDAGASFLFGVVECGELLL